MRARTLGSAFLIAATSILACDGTASPDAVAADDALTDATLVKTASSMRLYWLAKTTIANQATATGSLSKAPRDGSDGVGTAGFHVYRMTNEDDGIPTISVKSSAFQPFLIIKQIDCPACTKFVAGKRTATGWEIASAHPRAGTTEGPVVGAHDTGRFELYVTAVENLKASADPKSIGRAVAVGSYTLTTTLE